jgi:mRNA interferase YafQ
MYNFLFSKKFKKDFQRLQKTNLEDVKLTVKILDLLRLGGVKSVPFQMKPHKLKGNYKGNWECHIKPDLLIIWFQVESPNEITLVRLGSHSELFK